MQQASESIGSLAAALARAQVELINPEKSMVATIRPEGRGAAAQIFRYAPLSDGLNIIRKTLGQHEIATVQSTLVDQTAGLIRLNTVLAHRPANGSRRIGRFAPSKTWRARNVWGPRSPMRDATLYSRLLA